MQIVIPKMKYWEKEIDLDEGIGPMKSVIIVSTETLTKDSNATSNFHSAFPVESNTPCVWVFKVIFFHM